MLPTILKATLKRTLIEKSLILDCTYT